MSKKDVQNNKKRAVIKKDFNWYLKAAEQGDAKAQCLVGIRYNKGKGVKENKEEAFKWYKKSAKQGFPKAICLVGICYGKGWGVKENKRTAFKWYMKAAEQGFINAQCLVGICYSKGEGVKENKEEAFKWIMKAAEQGNTKAQSLVGIRYSKGEGVEKNEKEAFNWLLKAAKQGDVRAQYLVGSCYGKGEGIKKNKREALKWYKKAAEQGNDEAQYLVDLCYNNKGKVLKDNQLETTKKEFSNALKEESKTTEVDLLERLDTMSKDIAEIKKNISNKNNLHTKSEKTTVFVIMQFGGLFDILYNEVISPVCEKSGYKSIRSDKCHTPEILKGIIHDIEKASLVIADITMNNPNVFYELGYAHALKKPTILLADKDQREKLPFDIQGYRTIFYKNTISGKGNMENELLESIENMTNIENMDFCG